MFEIFTHNLTEPFGSLRMQCYTRGLGQCTYKLEGGKMFTDDKMIEQ